MKKNKLIIIPLCLTLFLAGCGGKNPVYTGNSIVVKPAPNVEEGDFKLNAIKKPSIPSALTEKETSPGTIVNSIYYDSLPISKQKIYNELLNTVLINGSNYIPSDKINADELKKIMRVIYIDEPAAYALKYSYIYSLDSNGNVSKVSLYYHDLLLTESAKEVYNSVIKKDTEKELKLARDTFSSQSTTSIDDDQATVLNSLKRMYEESNKKTIGIEEENLIKEKYLKEYLEHISKTALGKEMIGSFSEESAAKAFSAILKNNGIPSAVVVGERSSDITKNKFSNNFSGLKETEEKLDKGIRVTVDTSGLNFWNIFKIGTQWYNADAVLSKSIVEKIKKADEKTSVDNETFFAFGMSDEQSSVSKLSHINEDILGVTPMSYDDLASSNREEASIFIENSSQSRLSDDIVKKLHDVSFDRSFTMSFSQIDVFNAFVLSKDILIEKFKTQKVIKFNSYKTIIFPEIQSVYFYDIK